MALTKLTTDLIDGTFGTEWVSTIQTSNFTAEAGKGYFVNTTSAEITINLPAGVVGTEIVIQDYAGTFATNQVILAANGSEKIQGITDNFKCETNNATVTLIYQDPTKGWTADNIALVVPPLVVDYLVVAGGGGCGRSDIYYGGGGGGGGFRTSISSDGNGGGASSETALEVNDNGVDTYTITVGAGGSAAGDNSSNGSTGSNSVFSTVTSTGGGGGGKADTDGLAGGSGGGGGGNDAANSGGAAVSPTQGYAGGGTNSGYALGGGGGGGAGSIGSTATAGGANGGDAKASTITGPSVYFSAGGGGKRGYSSASNGAAGSNWRQTNSGCGGTATSPKSGQSGIVIIKYSNTKTATIGSGLVGSTTTSGSDKITTFTAGTGTITFS